MRAKFRALRGTAKIRGGFPLLSAFPHDTEERREPPLGSLCPRPGGSRGWLLSGQILQATGAFGAEPAAVPGAPGCAGQCQARAENIRFTQQGLGMAGTTPACRNSALMAGMPRCRALCERAKICRGHYLYFINFNKINKISLLIFFEAPVKLACYYFGCF